MATIKKKLDSQQYSCAKECIDDFHLMFNNCFTYNGEKEVSDNERSQAWFQPHIT